MVLEILTSIAAVGLLFSARQARIRSAFLKQHGGRIRQENEAIAANWRSHHPQKKRFLVERAFKPEVFLAPTVRVRQRFRRDGRSRRPVKRGQ